MLKNFKKVSVFVLIIIMTVGMIGCSTIYKILDDDTYYYDYTDYISEYDTAYAEELRQRIQTLEELYENASEDEKQALRDELITCKYDMIWCDVYVFYARDNGISRLSYKYDLLDEIYNIRCFMFGLELDEKTSTEEYRTHEARCNELDKYIKDDDYAAYIDNENKRIADMTNISDARKEALISYNNALLSLNPTGEFESWEYKNEVNSLLSMASTLSSSLENDVDLEYGGNLTAERRTEIERDLAILQKRISGGHIEADADDTLGGTSYTLSAMIGSMLSIIIIILLSGSLMSHEMSTGTIKSLIIAPVKRWKIYTAKYLSIAATVVFISIYTYLVAAVVNGLYFGFGNFADKIVYVGGSAVQMNYFLYQFISALFNIIPLLVIATFAYMLSIVTKNTAAAVSVTMGIYLGGNILHMVLVVALSNHPYIIQFLPFSNIELFGKIFYTASGASGNIGFGALLGLINNLVSDGSSIVFSAVYVIVLLVCMIYTGLDHFCRKDIK